MVWTKHWCQMKLQTYRCILSPRFKTSTPCLLGSNTLLRIVTESPCIDSWVHSYSTACVLSSKPRVRRKRSAQSNTTTRTTTTTGWYEKRRSRDHLQQVTIKDCNQIRQRYTNDYKSNTINDERASHNRYYDQKSLRWQIEQLPEPWRFTNRGSYRTSRSILTKYSWSVAPRLLINRFRLLLFRHRIHTPYRIIVLNGNFKITRISRSGEQRKESIQIRRKRQTYRDLCSIE